MEIKVFHRFLLRIPFFILFLHVPLKDLHQRNDEGAHEGQVCSRHKLPRKVKGRIHFLSNVQEPNLLLSLLLHKRTLLVLTELLIDLQDQLMYIFALVNVSI